MNRLSGNPFQSGSERHGSRGKQSYSIHYPPMRRKGSEERLVNSSHSPICWSTICLCTCCHPQLNHFRGQWRQLLCLSINCLTTVDWFPTRKHSHALLPQQVGKTWHQLSAAGQFIQLPGCNTDWTTFLGQFQVSCFEKLFVAAQNMEVTIL